MTPLMLSDIHLSVHEHLTLFRASRRQIPKNECFDRLYRLELVEDDWVAQSLTGTSIGVDTMMSCTDFGRDYLSFRRGHFWPEFRNWVSLIIAVAAFIKSFFFT